jgi:hypothetical protein
MDNLKDVVNKVDQHDLVVFDLETLLEGIEIATLDLATLLDDPFFLREQSFRARVKALEVSPFAGAYVAITDSSEAIVPNWAYMLLSARLMEVAKGVHIGDEREVRSRLLREKLTALPTSTYRGQTVIIKGCGSGSVPPDAYAVSLQVFARDAKKVMFGEPCSSVPVWRRPKDPTNVS